MKKIVFLTLVMMVATFVASAQIGTKNRINTRCGNSRLTAFERNDLRRDAARIRTAKIVANRDGVVTPKERVVISRMKKEMRRDVIRYSVNRRNRF